MVKIKQKRKNFDLEKLNLEQRRILQDMQDSDNWDIYLLTGPAGSGKTTLLEAIQEYWKEENYKTYPGAFTGRAAAVLKQRGLSKARTIHYHIFGRPTMYQQLKKLAKLMTLKEKRQDGEKEIWIIDESSMIDQNLLTLLLDHIYHNNKREKSLPMYGNKLSTLYEDEDFIVDKGKKIVFCGDVNQLVPIRGDMYALDKESLMKKFKVKEGHLTSLIRHEKSEGIHRVAKEIESIQGKVYCDLISLDNQNVFCVDTSKASAGERLDLLSELFMEKYSQNPFQIKYVNFTNQYVHDFNLYVRAKIHDVHVREKITDGEMVHVTQNNYYYDLWNGDHLMVNNVGKTLEGPYLETTVWKLDDEGKKIKKPNYKELKSEGKKDLYVKETKELKLSFCRLNVLHTETKEEREVFCIEESLNNEKGDQTIYNKRENLQFLATNYLKDFFFYRNPELRGKKYSDFKEEWETDEYNNALFLNYSYAITGHKSQGGEWDSVIVDLNTIHRHPEGWRYTSITRATDKVYIVPQTEDY